MTFKRFNVSEMDSYNTGQVYDQGTLTWNDDEGLRLHDGTTSGGSQFISVSTLKTLVAASTDFADFQTRISAL